MWASGAAQVDLALRHLLEDLCFIDERKPDPAAWWPVAVGRFGPYGLGAMDQRGGWFDTPGLRTAEAASLFAEVAHALGYLAIRGCIDGELWEQAGVDDAERFRARDWRISELAAILPDPSMAIRGQVWCFAPSAAERRWVYLDFDCRPPWSADHLLRDVRLPAAKTSDGSVLTPHGRTVAADWLGGHPQGRVPQTGSGV